MTELNKYMLVVMNHENFTQEELDAYANAAADTAAAADAAADAAYVTAVNTDAEDYAKYISYGIIGYFKRTGEDRALYEAEIERINGANNE